MLSVQCLQQFSCVHYVPRWLYMDAELPEVFFEYGFSLAWAVGEILQQNYLETVLAGR